MSHDEPLNSEERELARLLGRGREAAPSAAVDAAILAAARAAVQRDADAALPAHAAPHRPRAQRRLPRWPAITGIAASVLVAFGLDWQLQPPAPERPQLHEASGSPASAHAPAAAPLARRAMSLPAPTADVPPESQRDQTPPAAGRMARSEPAPAAAPAASVMATPAPHAPASDAPGQSRVPAAATQESATTARAPAPAPYSALPSASPDHGHTAGFLQQLDADQRLPRRQWLSQIRRHRQAGNLELARCSLTYFLLHHPGTRVPDDLRELMEQ